jgi:hypothetical protein
MNSKIQQALNAFITPAYDLIRAISDDLPAAIHHDMNEALEDGALRLTLDATNRNVTLTMVDSDGLSVALFNQAKELSKIAN